MTDAEVRDDSAVDETEVGMTPHEDLCRSLEFDVSELLLAQTQVTHLLESLEGGGFELASPSTLLRKRLLAEHPWVLEHEDFDDLWPQVEEFLTSRELTDEGGTEGRGEPHEQFIRRLFSSGRLGRAILVELEYALQRLPRSKNRLLDSLFTSMVADFEIFVGTLMRRLAEGAPAVACSGEAKYSLSNLVDCVDPQRLVDQAVAEWVRQTMHGGYDKWFTVLSAKFSIPPFDSSRRQVVAEVFERRHAIIHAGGIAGREYMNCGKPLVKEGDSLGVDTDYLKRSMDVLVLEAVNAAGRAMTASALKTKDPEDMDLALGVICDLSYRLLRNERFSAVERYISSLPIDKASVGLKSSMQVNRWIAQQKLGRGERVRVEVEAWRAEDLADPYLMAKHALLGDDERTFELSKKLVEQQELLLRHWLEWPILAGARRYAHEKNVFPVDPFMPSVDQGPDQLDETLDDSRPAETE